MIKRSVTQFAIMAAANLCVPNSAAAHPMKVNSPMHQTASLVAAHELRSSASQSHRASPQQEAEFERFFQLLRRGDYLVALNALEAHFPEDFDLLKDEIRITFLQGALPIEIVSSRTVLGRVVTREMSAIVHAPDDYLIDYLIANRDTYATAAEHMPELCNQISSGVFTLSEPPAPELSRALARTAASLIQAAAASRVRRVEREFGPLSESEFDLWVREMVRLGMTAEDAALIDDPSLMATASPVRTCQIRQLIIDAALALPSRTSARFSAGMLSSTMAQRQP
jgi:hypothetical protein